MKFQVGDRAFFRCKQYECNGYVVATRRLQADGNERVWFLPDDGFEIPSFYHTTEEYIGAFGTMTKYLSPISEAVKIDIDITTLL